MKVVFEGLFLRLIEGRFRWQNPTFQVFDVVRMMESGEFLDGGFSAVNDV